MGGRLLPSNATGTKRAHLCPRLNEFPAAFLGSSMFPQKLMLFAVDKCHDRGDEFGLLMKASEDRLRRAGNLLNGVEY